MSGFQKGDFEASTVIAILAVGGSNRLGRPKQLVQWRGTSLLQHVVDTASQFAPRVLLTLGAEADALWRTLCAPASLERVDVPDHRDGMSASLRAAVARAVAGPRGATPAGDAGRPVRRRRCLAARPADVSRRASAAHGRLALRRPARRAGSFPGNTFTALAALRGDQGARALLRDDANPIDFIAPHAPGDVDTPAQIPRL